MRKKIVTILSVVRSIITIVGVLIHEGTSGQSQKPSTAQESQGNGLQASEQDEKRTAANAVGSGAAPEGAVPGTPNSSQENTYRLHAGETVSLAACQAKAETSFKRLEGIDYAMLTVIPQEGPPVSQAIMGAGVAVKFKCRENFDAQLSVVTLDDSRGFLDVALSITQIGAN
jgi:hypothetical protein